MWQPIEDLPSHWQELAVPELSSLAKVWMEQKERLEDSKAVKEFNERLRREWSIETGILERLYTIDRGITQLLIEQGIDATLIPHGATDRPVEEVVRILKDHNTALEGVFSFVASRERLTTSYIRQLHQTLTQHQLYVEGIDQFGNPVNLPLQKGEWKKWANNPTRPDGRVHEYCPPLQVAGEMERLVAFYQSHNEVAPEVNSAWLHHRFAQIHPFQDGNGRVARALATIEFLRAGWFPLVINRDQRGEYIAALEAADNGDLAPLVSLFARTAKRSFVRMLALSEDVLHGEAIVSVPQIVKSVVEVYEHRRQDTEEAYKQVELIAESLIEESFARLQNVADQMKQRLTQSAFPIDTYVARSREQNNHYYTAQIVSVANELNYFANVSRHRGWVRLHLVNGQKTHIVFSFHYLGKVNRGVMVCSAFIYFPEDKPEVTTEAEAEMPFAETRRICDELFAFSYTDSDRVDGVKSDFGKWFDLAISVGLTEWAKRL